MAANDITIHGYPPAATIKGPLYAAETSTATIAPEYRTAPETLQPDWQQIAEALKQEVGLLTSKLAQAKAMNLALEREWVKAAAEASDCRDLMAGAEAQLQASREHITELDATVCALKTALAKALVDATANAATCYDEQCRRIRAERERAG